MDDEIFVLKIEATITKSLAQTSRMTSTYLSYSSEHPEDDLRLIDGGSYLLQADEEKVIGPGQVADFNTGLTLYLQPGQILLLSELQEEVPFGGELKLSGDRLVVPGRAFARPTVSLYNAGTTSKHIFPGHPIAQFNVLQSCTPIPMKRVTRPRLLPQAIVKQAVSNN